MSEYAVSPLDQWDLGAVWAGDLGCLEEEGTVMQKR